MLCFFDVDPHVEMGGACNLPTPTAKISMDTLKNSTHSFIIRIWLEEIAVDAESAKWRGSITHVPSGKRRYFEVLKDIKPFISPFLQQMGIDSSNIR